MNYNFLFNQFGIENGIQGNQKQAQVSSIWETYKKGGGYENKKMTLTNTQDDPMLEEVPSLGVAPAVSYITDTHEVVFLEGSENKLIINTEEPHDIYVFTNATLAESVIYPVSLKAGRNEIPIADKFLQENSAVLPETKTTAPSKYFTIGLWNSSDNSPVIKDGQTNSISYTTHQFAEGFMYFFNISENYFNTDLYLTYKYQPKE